MSKPTREQLRGLVKAAQDESLANIRQSRMNARATKVADTKPYRGTAFKALVAAIKELV